MDDIYTMPQGVEHAIGMEPGEKDRINSMSSLAKDTISIIKEIGQVDH